MDFIEQTISLFSNMDFVTATLLVVGLICVIGEIYQPGTIALGVVGSICLVAGVISRSLSASDNESVFFIIFMLVAIVCSIVLISFMIMIRFARKEWVDHEPNIKKETIEDDHRYKKLLGSVGVTLSSLRPSGKAKIFDAEYGVYAEGFFIGQGERIKVVKIESGNIYVKKV